MARMTAEQLVEAALNCKLPAYYGYAPSWLAPDGAIVTGNSHGEIAEREVGVEDYDAMYHAGYLRLMPFHQLDAFSIEGRSTSQVTPAMRVTIARLLKHYKPSKANEQSKVAIVDRMYDAKTVHSPREFLTALMASYA